MLLLSFLWDLPQHTAKGNVQSGGTALLLSMARAQSSPPVKCTHVFTLSSACNPKGFTPLLL